MFVGDWIIIEDRIEIFEYFDFLRGEESRVDERERYEANVKEREDLDMVGRRDGGGQENCCGYSGRAEVALGEKFG